ncbi:MAG TPA: MBL fold metallo-hydrolase [Bryobacteraceae bacterium]|nr:MBL fold metallo-hydrolase [Bryobacteraceae bacterium]
MTKRIWVLGGFTVLVVLAFFVTGTDAQPGTVKQIVPGVWFREGDLMNLGHCNNIIIEMQDYLIVVDANFPSGARLAMEAAKKVSNKPVKYVFDTHHHGDHAYGNPLWTRTGAITLAYKGVAEEMKRYEPARWQATAKGRPDVAEMHRDAPEPPKQTFDKSPFILKDATREVRFYFFGWAHTRGDGFVYLPKEKVLCTGDAVVNGPYNATSDGNVGNWPNVVRAAQKLDLEHVLPGHGGPGGKEVLEGQIQFMIELHKAVAAAVKQGKKIQDIVSSETRAAFGNQVPVSTSIRAPDHVKNWVGPFLALQVKDAYEEITQQKPHGDLPH